MKINENPIMPKEDKVNTGTAWNQFLIVSNLCHILKFMLKKKLKLASQMFVNDPFLKDFKGIMGNNR